MFDKNEPLCSICCLGYNHANYIRQSIESLWGQEYKNIEIIVVDDCSVDNSLQILETLYEVSPIPMKVLSNKKNSGNVGANFNICLHHAKGEYIMFMSLDDYLYTDSVSSKVALMKKDKNIVFVVNSMITEVDELNNIKQQNANTPMASLVNPRAKDILNLDYRENHSFYIQGTLFQKRIIDLVGGFDEDMVGDDIILRAKVLNYIIDNRDFSFKILNCPGCYYRIHSSNLHKNSFRQIQIIAQYLDKYHHDRPIPKKFKLFFYKALKKSDWETVLKLFEINDVTRRIKNMPVTYFKLFKKHVKSFFTGINK